MMLVITLKELLGIISHFIDKMKTLFFVLVLGVLMMWNCAMPFGSPQHEAFLVEHDIKGLTVKIILTVIVLFWPLFIGIGLIRWLFTPGE